MKLIVNPGLSMQPFHGSSEVPLLVCEVPDTSGRPRRYLVPQHLGELLDVCGRELDRSDAFARMAERSNGRYTTHQIERLAGDFLIPRQVLLDPEAASKPSIAARRLDRYLFFKLRFLKKEVVLPIASGLRGLFQPAVWKCFIALILASHLWFYLRGTLPQLDSLPDSDFPLFLLVLSFSALLHEFGHAAALTRFGGRSAEIGVGVYICFLALFVDLSEAWRLTNRQRVIVDLSGMYFQGILLIFLAIAFAATGDPVWACCFLFTDIQIAANLNPLLRLDGYWALADGLGIPNLRRRSMRYAFVREIKNSGRSLRTIKIYLALSLAFSVYLGWTLSRQCYSIIRNYPEVVRATLHSWQAGPVFDALSASLAALWRGMILISVAVLLIRGALWLFHQARWRNKKKLPDRVLVE